MGNFLLNLKTVHDDDDKWNLLSHVTAGIYGVTDNSFMDSTYAGCVMLTSPASVSKVLSMLCNTSDKIMLDPPFRM